MGDNILAYNGGCVIAMAGKGCIAIASDMRFGIKNQTVAFDCSKVFKVTDRCLVGFPGLITDSLTVKEKLKFRTNLYELREDREMKPKTIASVISSMLYERRFGPYFVEPVIAGLQDGTPYLCAMDLIGAPVYTDDFVLAGTASEALYGLAESLWKPDLGPDELFEVISQTMLSATNRDCLSGWGARVYVLTEKSLVIKDLKGRQD